MDNTNFTALKFHFSFPPTNFRTKYENSLKNRNNIHCFINANVTDLHLVSSLDTAKSVEVTNYNHETFIVHAKIFVFAAGGIENARLLLNFNKQQKEGIGNAAGLLGKYFSDHPHGVIGQFILEDLQKKKIEQLNINKNSNLLFPIVTRGSYEKKSASPPMTILLGLNPNLFSENHGGFKEKVRSIICSTSWTKELADWYTEKNIACLEDGTIHIETDQSPNEHSMITLSDEKDAFGLKRVNLHWDFTEQDIIKIKHNIRLFAETFARENIGRIKLEEWVLSKDAIFPKSISGGEHHMGTTRMAKSRKFGVVDKNLRVFGMRNLYIGGSSVFPTYGKVNPTFTIVQLTLRLAEHLNQEINHNA